MKDTTGNATDHPESPDSERVLQIRFRDRDEAGLTETLRALDDGDTDGLVPHLELVYHDPDDVHRVTRPKNLELLRAIVQSEPESIRETARVVDRDVSQVHRNLSELEALGLIELETHGQSKRPTVWYDAVEIDLPLDRDDGPEPAAT